MYKCPKCNTKVNLSDNFCTSCGSEFKPLSDESDMSKVVFKDFSKRRNKLILLLNKTLKTIKLDKDVKFDTDPIDEGYITLFAPGQSPELLKYNYNPSGVVEITSEMFGKTYKYSNLGEFKKGMKDLLKKTIKKWLG